MGHGASNGGGWPRPVRLAYTEWDEYHEAVLRVDSTWEVSPELLFVCKLVNGTMLGRRLWEHTSNESEHEGASTIYLRPWDSSSCSGYGRAIEEACFRYYDTSSVLELQYWFWRGGGFEPEDRYMNIEPLAAAAALLDHYRTIRSRECEVIGAVLDMERNKVLLFVKES